MKDKIIAVTGATGQQGGVVARKLLADGWKVRALTRDVDKRAAQELASLGAETFPGDMEDRAQLDAAFNGAYGVFSVQNFWLPNVGFEGETRQGKNVAEAARTDSTSETGRRALLAYGDVRVVQGDTLAAALAFQAVAADSTAPDSVAGAARLRLQRIGLTPAGTVPAQPRPETR